jgi:hypothetical protein
MQGFSDLESCLRIVKYVAKPGGGYQQLQQKEGYALDRIRNSWHSFR